MHQGLGTREVLCLGTAAQLKVRPQQENPKRVSFEKLV